MKAILQKIYLYIKKDTYLAFLALVPTKSGCICWGIVCRNWKKTRGRGTSWPWHSKCQSWIRSQLSRWWLFLTHFHLYNCRFLWLQSFHSYQRGGNGLENALLWTASHREAFYCPAKVWNSHLKTFSSYSLQLGCLLKHNIWNIQ